MTLSTHPFCHIPYAHFKADSKAYVTPPNRNLSILSTCPQTSFPTSLPPHIPLAYRSLDPKTLHIAPSSGSQTLDPNIVIHNTKPTYFKRIPRGAEDSVITEVSVLLRIQNLDPANKLPIPRLLALVQDPDGYGNNHIIGILLTLINAAGDLGTLATDAPGPLKRRWYRTVVHSVKTLHSKNIIWGDVKADNVLIDHQQNAWLIDFRRRGNRRLG